MDNESIYLFVILYVVIFPMMWAHPHKSYSPNIGTWEIVKDVSVIIGSYGEYAGIVPFGVMRVGSPINI